MKPTALVFCICTSFIHRFNIVASFPIKLYRPTLVILSHIVPYISIISWFLFFTFNLFLSPRHHLFLLSLTTHSLSQLFFLNTVKPLYHVLAYLSSVTSHISPSFWTLSAHIFIIISCFRSHDSPCLHYNCASFTPSFLHSTSTSIFYLSFR